MGNLLKFQNRDELREQATECVGNLKQAGQIALLAGTVAIAEGLKNLCDAVFAFHAAYAVGAEPSAEPNWDAVESKLLEVRDFMARLSMQTGSDVGVPVPDHIAQKVGFTPRVSRSQLN